VLPNFFIKNPPPNPCRQPNTDVTIRAIILDIGGVLEITPDPQMTGLIERWGKRLHCEPNITAAREFGMRAILFGDTSKAFNEVGVLLQDSG
jgi:hypothetical protein